MSNVVITIDLNKKCAECRKPGATGSGICLTCLTKIMAGKPMKSREGQAVARRVNAMPRKQTA